MLRSMLFSLTLLTVLLGTLWGGWLHGRMRVASGNNKSLLATAAQRLNQPLGDQLGNWRLIADTPFADDVVQMLQCPAHISRNYIHQQTGDVVSAMVIVGPPGPVSVHKPEVCYGSQNFEMLGDRASATITDRLGQKHSVWKVSMEPRNGIEPTQTVLYAWGTGKAFDAPHEPRISYSSQPYIYKIQLAGPLKAASDEFKPTEDFLSWFLPEIQAHLVPTQPDAPVVSSTTK